MSKISKYWLTLQNTGSHSITCLPFDITALKFDSFTLAEFGQFEILTKAIVVVKGMSPNVFQNAKRES